MISVEQRAHRRYSINLDFRFEATIGTRIYSGTGVTRDISSGGIGFRVEPVLPTGEVVELVVDWPVLQYGVDPLRLKVHGRIVRGDQYGNAARILRHEFISASAEAEMVGESDRPAARGRRTGCIPWPNPS